MIKNNMLLKWEIRNLKQVLNHGLVLKKCIGSLNLIKKPG